MSGWNVSSRSIGALNGVRISRQEHMPRSVDTPNNLAILKVNGTNMNITHVHDVYEGRQPVAIRQVKLDVDLQRGLVSGSEELIGENYETIQVQTVGLGSEGDNTSRLPFSMAKIGDYLR